MLQLILATSFFLGLHLALIVFGGRSVNIKRRDKLGAVWPSYVACTSVIPFQAIRQGRNRLVWGEINPWSPVVAILLYVLVMHFHMQWFGVSPLM